MTVHARHTLSGSKPRPRVFIAGGRVVALAWTFLTLTLALGGCLGEPPIEDRWTRLDVVRPGAGATFSPDSMETVMVRGRVTWRDVLTGTLIADLRASTVIGHDDVALRSDTDREAVLDDVELILSNSGSVAAQGVPVTGWDHLVQEVEFSFEVRVPRDGQGPAYFLLLYLGTEETIEFSNGEEATVFHAFPFEDMQILPTGVELRPAVETGASQP